MIEAVERRWAVLAMLAGLAGMLWAQPILRDRGEVLFFHNDRVFPERQVYEFDPEAADPAADLLREAEVGDLIGFRVMEGTNQLEEVTGTVDERRRIWFSNQAEIEVEHKRLFEIFQELSYIDNLLRAPDVVSHEPDRPPGR
jgi:hypothetical protein